jgi:anthranilate/para-aminobenzoate synthase component II
MKNILIINNNPNNDSGIYTPILINNIKNNHKVYECRNIKDVNNLINQKININLIITCGSSINLMKDVNISEHINKTTLAILTFPEVPIVGICFGMQLLCLLYGCSLYEKKRLKPDFEELYKIKESKLFENISDKFDGYCTNNIFCDFTNVNNLDILVKDKNNNIMSFKHKYKEIYGIQFHGEINKKNTINQIIKNILKL